MATQKIKIVKTTKVNFRKDTARALYYALLLAHDGQSVDSFVAAAKTKCPCLVPSGKHKGKAEPIRGWIGWFVRNGYVTIK